MHLILTPTLWGGAIAPHSAREVIISKAGGSDRCHCVTTSYVSEPHGVLAESQLQPLQEHEAQGTRGPRGSHPGDEGQRGLEANTVNR